MYVCMYVCMYVYPHIHTYTHMCVHVCVCVYGWMHVCMCACLYACERQEDRLLHQSEILQIGGRAGRFGTGAAANGSVTTLHAADLDYVRRAFEGRVEALEKACLRPELEALEQFVRQMQALYRRTFQTDVPLAEVLEVYEEMHHVQDESTFFLGDSIGDLQANAEALHGLEMQMPLSDMFVFCMAPVDLDSPPCRTSFVAMAQVRCPPVCWRTQRRRDCRCDCRTLQASEGWSCFATSRWRRGCRGLPAR